MAVNDEINRVKFIAEDFGTYRDEADAYFAANYPEDFKNAIATNLGNAMLDQLAFAMQSLSFLVNRRASEMFLATARLNKSITKLARMLGYPIKPAAPATVNISVVMPGAPFTFPVTIPVGFQFNATGGVIYEYQGAIDFVVSPGTTTFTIPVKEGQTRRTTFISDGSANQQFLILGVASGESLYAEDMILTVDGSSWTRQDLIKFQTATIFEILFTEDPPKLRFGDGIAGSIPPVNSHIVISYRSGKGIKGSVGKNQILSPTTPLVINNQTIQMTLTNPVSDAGQDAEDIRHVRAFSSSFFRTQNAAVIKSDYDTIALQTGVSLADAQIMRGIDNDITIQSAFTGINSGIALVNQSVTGIAATSVTGQASLGVSGIPSLLVGGVSGLGVSGIGTLGISGTELLGWNGSSVTGIGFLGLTGQPSLGVSGIAGLFIGGLGSLGVSGLSFLGISSVAPIIAQSASGFSLIQSSVSGLSTYLSQTMSDTSKANNVQVVVLSVDPNNKYISPSTLTLQAVQSSIQSIADAAITVTAVDGISKVVPVNIQVDMGINQNAVKADVEQISMDSLVRATTPFGLLVKRQAGKSLYVSDIEDAIRGANAAGDIRYINVKITAPSQYIDADGNLIVGKQQIIQNGIVSVTVKKRFLTSGEVVNA